jgi:hypothetical protein
LNSRWRCSNRFAIQSMHLRFAFPIKIQIKKLYFLLFLPFSDRTDTIMHARAQKIFHFWFLQIEIEIMITLETLETSFVQNCQQKLLKALRQFFPRFQLLSLKVFFFNLKLFSDFTKNYSFVRNLVILGKLKEIF